MKKGDDHFAALSLILMLRLGSASAVVGSCFVAIFLVVLGCFSVSGLEVFAGCVTTRHYASLFVTVRHCAASCVFLRLFASLCV